MTDAAAANYCIGCESLKETSICFAPSAKYKSRDLFVYLFIFSRDPGGCHFLGLSVTHLMCRYVLYFISCTHTVCDVPGKENPQENPFVCLWPSPSGHVPISLLVYSGTLSL